VGGMCPICVSMPPCSKELIERMNSSMPWYVTIAKTLTLQHLRVGRVGKTGLIGTGCCQNAAKTSGPQGLIVWGQPFYRG
jgi:hypothetical protein